MHFALLPRPTRNELVLPQVESQLGPRPRCRLELGREHVERGACGRSFAGAASARGRDRLKLHELIPQTQERLRFQDLRKQVREVTRGLHPLETNHVRIPKGQHPFLPAVDVPQLGALDLVLGERQARGVIHLQDERKTDGHPHLVRDVGQVAHLRQRHTCRINLRGCRRDVCMQLRHGRVTHRNISGQRPESHPASLAPKCDRAAPPQSDVSELRTPLVLQLGVAGVIGVAVERPLGILPVRLEETSRTGTGAVPDRVPHGSQRSPAFKKLASLFKADIEDPDTTIFFHVAIN